MLQPLSMRPRCSNSAARMALDVGAHGHQHAPTSGVVDIDTGSGWPAVVLGLHTGLAKSRSLPGRARLGDGEALEPTDSRALFIMVNM